MQVTAWEYLRTLKLISFTHIHSLLYKKVRHLTVSQMVPEIINFSFSQHNVLASGLTSLIVGKLAKIWDKPMLFPYVGR